VSCPSSAPGDGQLTVTIFIYDVTVLEALEPGVLSRDDRTLAAVADGARLERGRRCVVTEDVWGRMPAPTSNYSSFSLALGNENRSVDGFQYDLPAAIYSFHLITTARRYDRLSPRRTPIISAVSLVMRKLRTACFMFSLPLPPTPREVSLHSPLTKEIRKKSWMETWRHWSCYCEQEIGSVTNTFASAGYQIIRFTWSPPSYRTIDVLIIEKKQ